MATPKLDVTKPVEFLANPIGGKDRVLPARIVCSDRKGNPHFPIIALVDNADRLGGEKAMYFKEDGDQGPYPPVYGFLRNKKETIVRWAVVAQAEKREPVFLHWETEQRAKDYIDQCRLDGVIVRKQPFKIEVELD